MKFLENLYELLNILVGILLYGTALIPCYFVISWGLTLGFPWFLFIFPATFFLYVITLILIAGSFKCLFVPALKPGTYKFSTDKHVVTWIINRTITEYVLLPFNRIIFLNDFLRYTCLRLFGVKLDYTTSISTPYISDFGLLSFGKNTIIGGWVVMYCHVEPDSDTLILAPSKVGDYSTIGARTDVGCGAVIGDKTIIGFGCMVGMYCTIGNRCNIGMKVSLGHRTVIEDNAEIGKYSSLGNGVKVKQGIKLPDFSQVPDFAVIETQEVADKLGI